ncbi:MAG: ATP-dependent DNA helicase RecG [Ornithinimicrobium sp.]
MAGLDTPLRTVLGTSAAPLSRARGMSTVGDLLDLLPRAYLDPARPTDFTSVADGDDVVVIATVVQAVTRPMRQRRGKMLVATVADADGHRMDLTFFRPFGHERVLVPGARVVCSGTVGSYAGRRQLTHPEYQVLETAGTSDGQSGLPGPDGSSSPSPSGTPVRVLSQGLVPVYPTVKGMSPIALHAAVDLALHSVDDMLDPLPEQVRERRGLPSLLSAYRLVHQPETAADARRGRWRMKYAEAFVIQASLAVRRHSSQALPAQPRPGRGGALADTFTEQLPFALTHGQQDVLATLRDDLARSVPMHRLLQGEVGSGKTVLALLAMLTVIDSGGQAALLAPTEVLAAQHLRSITLLLGPLAQAGMLSQAEHATRVALLTGSQTAAQRRSHLSMAAGGEAGIVVGTHAMIQEHVQFAELGLVVVDEQHRFGVEQRDALRVKAGAVSPHVLVMTATPIPRTVAMTVFGDMEVSTLRELPGGRQPISTHVVSSDKPGWVRRMWQRVAEEAGAGHRVYVVCPRIGSPDDPELSAGGTDGEPYPGPGGPIEDAAADEDDSALHGVWQVHRALAAAPATSSLRLAMVHGRMPPADKDTAMQDFAAGSVDVLVATTVVEVGVDVPEATVMVVLDADRFGISQLHQLRGRVGRGQQAGLCLLVTQHPEGSGRERLDTVASTTDGFELARADLESRREGDVLGATQSGGRSGLRFLQLTRDEELIVQAHEDAWATVQGDPDLSALPALREELARVDAERAAYLERG